VKKFFIIMTLLLGVAGLFICSCEKKSEPAVAEDEVLPEDEIDLLEEPDLESVEDMESQDEALAEESGQEAASDVSYSETGRYVVQVSVFKSRRMADNMKEKLSAMGYPSYVAEVNDPVPELIGTYYRVRIGRFAGLSEARAFGENILQPQQYDFWVDLKSNDNIGGSFSSSETQYESSPAASSPVYESEAASPASGAEEKKEAEGEWSSESESSDDSGESGESGGEWSDESSDEWDSSE
jgi:hypothetical protein